MLDGERLVGFEVFGEYEIRWNGDGFVAHYCDKEENGDFNVWEFEDLRRKPVKKTRPMTRDEVLAWAVSGEALGWVVVNGGGSWLPPQCFIYNGDMSIYHRARIAPDGTISDEQGFEVAVGD
jgi:hypothetical protein